MLKKDNTYNIELTFEMLCSKDSCFLCELKHDQTYFKMVKKIYFTIEIVVLLIVLWYWKFQEDNANYIKFYSSPFIQNDWRKQKEIQYCNIHSIT